MLIDSHCHINSEELRLDAIAVITRARDAGVGKILIAGTDYEDSCEAAAMTLDFPNLGLYASVGIHPHESGRYTKVPEEFSRLVEEDKIVAVGEIGLDYHYNHSTRPEQQKMFELQLEFASEKNMPVILHIRDAMEDALHILRHYPSLKLLFHCYSGGLEYLDTVLELKGMCAFGGAITWLGKGADELREVVRRIPASNILMETDSPYMAPIPHRGKINEPAYITHIYKTAAQERGMDLDDFARLVEDNARDFFGWD